MPTDRSPAPSQTAEEVANKLLGITEAWDGGRPAHPRIVSMLEAWRLAAKREGAIEALEAVKRGERFVNARSYNETHWIPLVDIDAALLKLRSEGGEER
jgi:hypothetical protein